MPVNLQVVFIIYGGIALIFGLGAFGALSSINRTLSDLATVQREQVKALDTCAKHIHMLTLPVGRTDW